MRKLTIKTRLSIIIGLISISLIATGTYTFFSFKKIERLQSLSSSLDLLRIRTLEIRKSEKDYMLRDLYNETYFESHESKNIIALKNQLNAVYHELDSLKTNKDILFFSMDSGIEHLASTYKAYQQKFESIAMQYENKGYLNFGLVGQLRTDIRKAEESLKKAGNQADLMVHLLMLRRHEKDFFLRKDPVYQEQFTTEFNKFTETLRRKSLLNRNEIQSLLDSYKNSFEKVVNIDKIIGINENMGMMLEMREAARMIEPELLKMNEKINENTKKHINFTIISVLFLIGLIILIISLVVVSINKSILKSINLAQSTVFEISRGNLTVSISNLPKDEMGMLLNDVLIMNKKLRDIIVQINNGATSIASASQQLSSASEVVSQGASEQASSIEEVSSSIEEMASNIHQNTENTIQTEKISANLMKGIQSVNDASAHSLQSIHEIANKISIISDIAFQTNILALNAAVEAARAGEHGKGFAVVASEVRKLAERSKQAAEGINSLSRSCVVSTENSKNLMDTLAPEIKRTIQLIHEINASCIEQNSGAEQINNAVLQLNQVTQQNAASSEEMATSAEELASQAETLKETVSFFKI